MLAGRDVVIDQFLKAVRVGEWGAERALLLRGFRGVGKTALLEFLRRRVEDSGLVTIDETASAGFAGRIIQKLRVAIAERDAGTGVRIKALGNLVLGTVEVDYTEPAPVEPTMESLVDALASLVEPNGGILFTLDEVSEDTIDEFRIVSAALQRSISSDREIAFIVAGLHSDIAAIFGTEHQPSCAGPTRRISIYWTGNRLSRLLRTPSTNTDEISREMHWTTPRGRVRDTRSSRNSWETLRGRETRLTLRSHSKM
ncbi:MAG: ATP-binding protein [Rhodoglobus sp.]